MGNSVEIDELRADVERLQRLALTDEQRAAVERLARHVDGLVAMAEADRARRWLMTTARTWAVALGAVVAAFWVVRDGLARALKAILEG